MTLPAPPTPAHADGHRWVILGVLWITYIVVFLSRLGIGPLGAPEDARSAFRTLRGLADDLGLGVRSMGMTDDLEVAIQEGSTMVRIGTALFGPRRPPNLPRD